MNIDKVSVEAPPIEDKKEEGGSARTPSPIQQEIIDGVFYWDAIARDWFRLIERESQDVVGHCKREDSWHTTRWIAVKHGRYYMATGARDQQAFATQEIAMRWIEQHAKDVWKYLTTVNMVLNYS